MAFAVDTNLQPITATLTQNGAATGVVTIASTVGFYTDQLVTIADNNGLAADLKVAEVLSSTTMRLALRTGGTGAAGVDLSAYLVANSAKIGAASQQKVRASNPILGAYVQDPIAALRVLQVDSSGNASGGGTVTIANSAITVTQTVTTMSPQYGRLAANSVVTTSFTIAITASADYKILQCFNSLNQEVYISRNGSSTTNCWRLESGEPGFTIDLTPSNLKGASGDTYQVEAVSTNPSSGQIRFVLI